MDNLLTLTKFKLEKKIGKIYFEDFILPFCVGECSN